MIYPSSMTRGNIVASDLFTVDAETGKASLHLHEGQMQAWDSKKRFVTVNAGTQAGKTSFAPWWLWREIQAHGAGDYLAVTSTFPLLNLKLLPEFLRVFQTTLKAGRWWGANKIFELANPETGKVAERSSDPMWGRVIFGSAKNADSLESATAKAALLDECGQDQFGVSSWEAILRRLSLARGRALLTTCYDDQTEIYTDSGWKLIGELDDADKVYAPDENGVGSFEYPYRRTWEHYAGKMFHFRGGRIDLFVTPNHRILYNNGNRFYIRDAERFSKLSRRSLVIPKIVHPQIERQEYFILPSVIANHRWGKTERPEIKIPMSDWCAFLGWFLAEGCVRGCSGGKIKNGCYEVFISQSDTNVSKREQLKRDLGALPFKWSRSGNSFSTNNKQLWSYLSDLGNRYQKYIPKEVKYSGRDNLLILIDRMVLGDGTYSKKDGIFSYYTTSPQLAEDFREVCMLTGVSTGIRRYETKPFQGTNGNHAPMHHVWQRKRKSGIAEQCDEVDYDGYIGCVGTSTGLVLVRRSGEECICGNTLYNFGWLKQLVYDPWARGDRDDVDVIQFESIMNPMFPLEEFERARRDLPPWKFNMQYRGIYARPAGMIYDSFNEDLCKLSKPMDIPGIWPMYVGVDFGGVNMAALFTAENPENGVLYHFAEYLEGEKSIKQHAEAFRKLVGTRPLIWVGGAKPEDQWRYEFRQQGIPLTPPPISDVEVGISRVYSYHKNNKIFVFPHLRKYLDEKGRYSRKLDESNNATEEIENKNDYHLMDAERVMVAAIYNLRNRIGSEILPLLSQAYTSRWARARAVAQPLGYSGAGRIQRHRKF